MSSNKVSLITGGASGIGLATAQEFLKMEYTVILFDLDLEKLKKVRKNLINPEKVIILDGDVSNYKEVFGKADELIHLVGKVDVLVNNAGISMPKPVIEMDEEDWNKTININLKGAFNWCNALLPNMIENKYGKIINVSSMSAKHGGGKGTVSKACYAASKAGLLGFTKGLAREVAPHVLVNAVCPGLIKTPMTENLIKDSQDELLSMIPLHRFGSPEDVANIISYLASSKGDYLTGEVIDINGGMLID
jgi:3-oxoacyl-[acyl-carrier protein] reductase